MLKSLAKIAVRLDIDNVANIFMEKLYSNGQNGRGRFSRRFQVLVFHKVSPESHPFFEPIHPIVFEQYAQFLHRCYRVMDLEELVECSRDGDIPDRAVAITFDDGYRDNYEYAFPILIKYRLPATVFVTTGHIGTGKTLWHDRIFDAFCQTSATRLKLTSTNLPELRIDSTSSRQKAIWSIRLHARPLHGETMQKFIEEVEHALIPEIRPRQEDRMLTWDQIREMHRSGIKFGSHTVTHPILSGLPHAELAKELFESKRVLEEKLDAPVNSFAYPNGQASDYNETVKSVLRDCGYSFAVTTRPGLNRAHEDLFELKRGAPWQTDIELFRANFFLQRHGMADVRN
jgi:peptidoglycan/xylan/chitin deacetylase (PgdA/CDA1 family)